MINALHLLWIIPLSAWFGFGICAMLVAGRRGETEAATDQNDTGKN